MPMTFATQLGPLLAVTLGLFAMVWQWRVFGRLQRSQASQAIFSTERPVVEMWRTPAVPTGERLWARLDDGRTVLLANAGQMAEALRQLELAGFPPPLLRR